MKNIVFISGWAEREDCFDSFWKAEWNLKKFAPCAYYSKDKKDIPSIYAQKIIEEISSPHIFIAWSLGGMIAQEIAAIKPEIIEKLIIINSTNCFIKKEDNQFGVDLKLLRSMKLGLLNESGKTLKNFFHLAYDTKNDDFLEDKVKIASEFKVENLVSGLDYFLEMDLRNLENKINFPIYILHSEKDQIINPSLSKEIFKDSRDKKIIKVNSSNHALFQSVEVLGILENIVNE